MANPDLPADHPPIPCTTHVSDPSEIEAECRTAPDGRTALLVFSALDRLHTCRGSDQPRSVLPTANLQLRHDGRPLDLVLLDAVVPEDARREVSP